MKRAHVLMLAVALFALSAPAPAVWAEHPVVYDEALLDLNTLVRYVNDKRAINEQINQYLALVAHAYVNMKGPDAPTDAASDEEKAAYKTEQVKFDKLLGDYRKKADELLFKAFSLQHIRRKRNQRDAVNTLAAQLIGGLGKAYPGKDGERARETLSRKLRAATEKLRTIKHDLNVDVLRASFQALGDLGSMESLRWMLTEYSHIDQRAIDWLVAAHLAMVRFPVDRDAAAQAGRAVVPGTLRYAIVEKFVVTYLGVAWRATLSGRKPPRPQRRLWDTIRMATIPVLQHFAGEPRYPKTGNVLATLPAFQAWFADHRDFQAAPWSDAR